jgi:hypothetical protein
MGLYNRRKTEGATGNRRGVAQGRQVDKNAEGLIPEQYVMFTGYNRKSAGRLLRRKPVKNLTLFSDGNAGLHRCGHSRPRLIWTLLPYGCAGIPSSTKPAGTFPSLSDIRNFAPSPSPAHEPQEKRQPLHDSSNKKTAPWFVNSQGYDWRERLEGQTL